MEELKKDIESDIFKCIISAGKITTTALQREYLKGMIDAYSRVVYNIELNYSNETYEQIHEKNVEKWRGKI